MEHAGTDQPTDDHFFLFFLSLSSDWNLLCYFTLCEFVLFSLVSCWSWPGPASPHPAQRGRATRFHLNGNHQKLALSHTSSGEHDTAYVPHSLTSLIVRSAHSLAGACLVNPDWHGPDHGSPDPRPNLIQVVENLTTF